MSTQKQAQNVLGGGSNTAHQQGALLRITDNELGQLNDRAIAMGYPGMPQGGDGVYEAGFLDSLGSIAKTIAPFAAFIPGVGPAIAAGAAAVGGISDILGGGDEQPAGEVGMAPGPSISSAGTDPSAPSVVADPGEEPGWMDKLSDIDFGGIASILGKSMNAYDNMSGKNDDLGRSNEQAVANNDYYQKERQNLHVAAGRARPRRLPTPQYMAEGGPVEDDFRFNQDQYNMSQALNEMGSGVFGNPRSSGWRDPEMVDAYMRSNPYAQPGGHIVFGDDELPVFTGMRYPDYMEAPEAPPPEAAPPEAGPVAPDLSAVGDELVRPTTVPYMPGDNLANAQSDFFLNGGSATTPFAEAMAQGTPSPTQAAAMQLDMGNDPNNFNPLYPEVAGAGNTWNPESLNTAGLAAQGGYAPASDVLAQQQGYNPANPGSAMPALPPPEIAERPEVREAPQQSGGSGFLASLPGIAQSAANIYENYDDTIYMADGGAVPRSRRGVREDLDVQQQLMAEILAADNSGEASFGPNSTAAVEEYIRQMRAAQGGDSERGRQADIMQRILDAPGMFQSVPPGYAEGGLTATPAPPAAPINAGVNMLQEGQMNAAMQAGQPGAMPGGAQNMMYPQAQMPQLNPQLGPQMNMGMPPMGGQGGQGQVQSMAADPAYQGSAMRPQGHIRRQGHERMGGQGDEILAMVSPGEYMLSADVVSALGNGDTATGEQHLNAMVDDIRQAKYGSTQQAGMINPMEHLPQFGNV